MRTRAKTLSENNVITAEVNLKIKHKARLREEYRQSLKIDTLAALFSKVLCGKYFPAEWKRLSTV
jgi:hypothetical protein